MKVIKVIAYFIGYVYGFVKIRCSLFFTLGQVDNEVNNPRKEK